MNSRSFDPRREARELAKGIANPLQHEFLVSESITDIQNHLLKLQPSLSLCLEHISGWEGVCAEIQLLEGKLEGWSTFQRSYRLLCWSRHIRLAFLDARRGKKTASVSDFALLLAHAIAAGQDRLADLWGNRLVAALMTGDKRFTGWECSAFEPFMVRLYAQWRGISLESSTTPIDRADVYENILSNWRDDNSMVSLLDAACEYHLHRNEDIDDSDFPEFMTPPYRFFPVEVLAIHRIRQSEGYQSCLPDHPIMRTAFGSLPQSFDNLPQSPPELSDELLDQVIAKVRSEIPLGDLPL